MDEYENRVREFTEDKIAKDRARRKRQIKVRGLKGAIVGGAILLAGAIYGITKDPGDDSLTYDEIREEIYIHSGHAIGADGEVINPYLPHDCEVPYDGKTHFSDRLSQKMAEEGYSQEVIDTTVALFEQAAYGTIEDFGEAKEELDKMEKKLKKGKDGIIDFKDSKNNKETMHP